MNETYEERLYRERNDIDANPSGETWEEKQERWNRNADREFNQQQSKRGHYLDGDYAYD
jgi:hypothetical protein